MTVNKQTYYGAMIMKRNVPKPKEGYESKACDECGEQCWETPIAREAVNQFAASGRELLLVCTMCMLKKGASEE